MENKYKRLAKNSFWTLIGNTGSKLLGFLLLPLYTRWLGTAGFGESDLVTTYSTFLVYIMTLCAADGIFVFTKNQNTNTKKAFYSSTVFYISALLLIWAVVWGIMDFVFTTQDINNSFSNNLWYIYGIIVTTFLQQYSQQFILSLEKIRIYSFTGIVHSLLTLLFSYLLIPSMGVKGYILAMIYSNLLTAAYSFLLSKSYQYLSFKSIERDKVFELLKYSIPLIPNGIMWWLVSALNRPVMEYNLDYSAIGIYAVANRFPGIITMVFTVFSVAWNISVFEEYGKEGFVDFYKKIFRMLFLVIVIAASIVLLSSEFIISVFAAPEFREAWRYMIILVIGSVFSCISSFFGSNFSVVKQSKYFFYSSVWGAITAIVLNFVLIPLFGLWGTAITVMVSFIATMVSRYIYSMKYVPTQLISYIIVYAIALAIIAVICLLLHSFYIKILITIIVISALLIKERDVIKPIVEMVKSRITRV